jgi:8-oxo-dGTP pyrophosphatase MutT (NUDIX family)
MGLRISVADIRAFFSSFNREEIHDSLLTRAGVLIPLFENEGEIHVLFTKRTEDVEHHKGQISFPGGAIDRADKTIIDTALRESEEEIGLQRTNVEVLGSLNDYWTPSGFCITPVVGYIYVVPSLNPNPMEVTEVFNAPLSFFLDKTNERVEQRRRGDKVIDVYFYHYGNYEIWGATAAMLRFFLQTLVNSIERKKIL